MPPAISDDEMDDVDDVDVPDSIPARVPTKSAPADERAGDDDEDEDDDEDGEDEYQVEKILSHQYDQAGNVLYQIKWLGYEAESDQTWEPIDNLSGAKAILEAYHESIGGRPSPRKKTPAKKKSTKEKSTGRGGKRGNDTPEDSPAPAKKQRAGKANAAGPELPLGSWEDDVKVNAIVQTASEPGASKQQSDVTSTLKGLLLWKTTGRKTEHPMEVLRQKCPLRLLDYYEGHLLFKPNSNSADSK